MANDTSDNSNYALKRIRSLLDPAMLGPDRKLPTERALCEMLEVSRRSVRRALAVLEAEGHIWRRQGSGTFAGPAPVQILSSLEAVAKQSSYMEVMEIRLRLNVIPKPDLPKSLNSCLKTLKKKLLILNLTMMVAPLNLAFYLHVFQIFW